MDRYVTSLDETSIKNMKKKISTLLSVTFIILNVCLVGIITTTFLIYSSRKIYDEGIANLTQSVENTMYQIDSRLNSMEQTIVDTLAAPNFLEHWSFYQNNQNEVSKNLLKRAMTEAYKNKLDIRRVIIYDGYGNCISTDKYSISEKEVIERFESISEKYELNRINSHVFLEPHIDYWRPELDVTVIAEIKPIKDNNNNVVGYIEVQQNYFYISEICNLSWNKEPLNVFVFMGDFNNCLCEKRSDDCKESTELYASKTESYTKIRRDNGQIIATATSNYYNCRTVAVLSNKILYSNIRAIIWVSLLLAITVIAVSTIYIILTTKGILRPIHDLIRRMENTNLDNLNVEHVRKNTNWETEILESTFETMTERLKNTLEEQKKMHDLQNRTLFNALQSEIGPHFLYNSLGSIANMCELGENEEAADVCYSLTEILRYAANYTDVEVELFEEVANVRSYLAIMKSRYRHRLSYRIETEGKLHGFAIPKLTLQPLVENAIRYTLLEEEEVRILLRVEEKDSQVCIFVTDNGCGFSQEKKQMIKERVVELQRKTGGEIIEKIKFGGMGLSGTILRLTIFFGDAFSWSIMDNEEGFGTTILFKIDMKR